MTYTYKKSRVDEGKTSTSIIRIEDGACIPIDENNIDYQEYLLWVDKGNTIADAD
tara:strand:+ start:2003 stop:2167 length:165 start_codon:yes stop_codon:yes gene_type:complete